MRDFCHQKYLSFLGLQALGPHKEYQRNLLSSEGSSTQPSSGVPGSGGLGIPLLQLFGFWRLAGRLCRLVLGSCYILRVGAEAKDWRHSGSLSFKG